MSMCGRGLPTAACVFALGLAEILLCGLSLRFTHPWAEGLSTYVLYGLALSQVGLSSCWLVFGGRSLAWRLLTHLGLVFLWTSLLHPFGIADASLPWLQILATVSAVVFLGAVLGKLAGFRLLKQERDGDSLPADQGKAGLRSWQFSVKDLLVAMTAVAVVLGARRTPHFEHALGKPGWQDVSYLAITVALGFGVAWWWTWRPASGRKGYAGLLIVAFLGAWVTVLRGMADSHGEPWIGVHAALVILVIATSIVCKRGKRLSFEARTELRAQAANSTRSGPEELVDYLQNGVLVILAVAWLLGPLREGLDSLCRPYRFVQVMAGLCVPLAAPALWTWSILWMTLTSEDGWRRWGPSLGACLLGVFGLVATVELPGVLWAFVPLLLTQAALSWGTLVIVRRAGYRLSRHPCSDTRLRNQ